MIRKNVMLTEQGIADVKKYATSKGISFSEALRNAIDQFLLNNIVKKMDSVFQEGFILERIGDE